MEDRRLRAAIVTTYAIDGVERFESGLSEGLPANSEAAKAEALRRVRQLDDARMAPAKNAAIGLAKAVQYGVDRHPAIVFDGRAVVCGVTDLVDLLGRWQWGGSSEEVIGQGVNTVTGDYSRRGWSLGGACRGGLPGSRIHDRGRLRVLFRCIVATGRDQDLRRRIRCGSLLVDHMTVAGS